MVTLFAKKEPAPAPTLEDDAEFRRTYDEMIAANRRAAEADAQWRQVQDRKRSADVDARLDALAAEKDATEACWRAEAAAVRAREAHRVAREQALGPIREFHRQRIREAVPAVAAGLESLRDGPYAEMMRRIDDAIAAKVGASTLPLSDLGLGFLFGKNPTTGETYFENWRRSLRKEGFL